VTRGWRLTWYQHQSPGAAPRGSLRSRRANRPGLTLLEVLLAMAILLLSLVGIGKLVDFGSDRAVEAKFQASGTRLAHSKLAEVEAGFVAVSSESSGTFEDQEEPEWSWSVSPTPEGTTNLYQVTVRVSRDFKGRVFEVSLTQFIVDPTTLGSAAQAEKPTESTDSGSGSSTGTSTSGSSSSAGTTGGTTP